MQRLKLSHREAHVWFIVPEAIKTAGTLSALQRLLSDDELQQYRRFYFARDSHRYLVSHALVRTVLSKYAEVAPAEWRFSHNRHGRPEIANAGDIPALRFNLTHTRGLAACIVSLSDACGIDAEMLVKRHDPLAVARRMFSETEYLQLRQLSDAQQLECFFKAWTLREAYVKAIGIGIAFPTHKLVFAVDADDSVAVSFHPDIDDRPQDWDFCLLRPTGEHIAATAVQSRDGVGKRIVTRFADL
jgi:4'-phosphopantetheinyl transferase